MRQFPVNQCESSSVTQSIKLVNNTIKDLQLESADNTDGGQFPVVARELIIR
jgi:hypothetical protein